jgi:endonuclease YncB( thermonuclease family)
MGKNGNPSMLFANEAKEYTMTKVDDQIVTVKLLDKDQYSRVIGKVVTDECFPISSFSSSLSSSSSSSSSKKHHDNTDEERSTGSLSMKKNTLCKPEYDHLDLSLGLAHNGYSTLYRGGGAQYNGNKKQLENEIQYAQNARKGVWMNGVDNAQSPAEYKKMMKEKQKSSH